MTTRGHGVIRNKNPLTLTPREDEVMKLYSEGHTLDDIISILGVKKNNIFNYTTHAKQKLGVDTLAQAVEKWKANKESKHMARKPNYTADSKDGVKGLPAEAESKKRLMSAADIEKYTTSEAEGVNAGNMIVPRLTVLQGLSPQVDRLAPEFIKGAQIGQICDVALGEVWDTIKILPCYYADVYLEWSPRGGDGLVHNYGTDSTEFDKLPANEKQKHYRRVPGKEEKECNEIVKTGTIWALNLSANMRPCFFPLSSTAYQAAKEFNIRRLEDKIEVAPGEWRKARMTTRIWDVTTFQRTKGDNKWYVPTLRKAETIFELPNGEALFEAAETFKDQVARGLVVTEYVREGDDDTSLSPNRPM